MNLERQKRIEKAREAVLSQTELFHRDFGRAASHWKFDGTRVTTADVAISEAIMAAVLGAFPGDQFFSEELAQSTAPVTVTAHYAWVLDPIDGTNNYATGIAHCAIALALLEDGVPIYGFVYDMSRRVLIQGGPGYGLWDGDRPASVKSGGMTPQSLLGFHSPYDRKYGEQARVLVENFKIRALGSSTLHLAYVAVGILDLTVDHNVKIWDIAAAIPLVQAGGGKVDYISSAPLPLKTFNLRMNRIQYLAGSETIVAQVRELLGV